MEDISSINQTQETQMSEIPPVVTSLQFGDAGDEARFATDQHFCTILTCLKARAWDDDGVERSALLRRDSCHLGRQACNECHLEIAWIRLGALRDWLTGALC